jgi:hypothetical protein
VVSSGWRLVATNLFADGGGAHRERMHARLSDQFGCRLRAGRGGGRRCEGECSPDCLIKSLSESGPDSIGGHLIGGQWLQGKVNCVRPRAFRFRCSRPHVIKDCQQAVVRWASEPATGTDASAQASAPPHLDA